MVRLVSFATLWLSMLGACTPEVELARPFPSGGAAGAEAMGGSGNQGNAGEGGEPPSAPPPRVLADSVSDFTLTQGRYGWYYGFDSGELGSFSLLTRTSVIRTFKPPSGDRWEGWSRDERLWTQIFRLGAHPNGTESSLPSYSQLERAVRRWVSDYEGDIVITGELAKIDLVGSNGVQGLVYVDGVQVYTATIDGDDQAGVIYEVRASVRVGSTVDFVLDPREGADHHDLSRFTGVISRAEAASQP
jgi:hypothetical protein